MYITNGTGDRELLPPGECIPKHWWASLDQISPCSPVADQPVDLVPFINALPPEGPTFFETLVEEIIEELEEADDKYPPMGDPREGIRTLQCEVMELDREIERQNKDYAAYRKEAVQVAAMGLKFLRDCGSEEDFKKLLKSCKC